MKKIKIHFTPHGYMLYMKLAGIKKRTVNFGEKEFNKLVAKMHALPFGNVCDVLNSMHDQYAAQLRAEEEAAAAKPKGKKKGSGLKPRTINPDIPPPKPGTKK